MMSISPRQPLRRETPGTDGGGAGLPAAPGPVLHVFDHSFPIGDGYAFRSGEVVRFLRRAGWDTVHVTSAKQGRRPAVVESVDGLEFHRTQPDPEWLFRLPVLNQWAVVDTLRTRLRVLVPVERPALLHVHSPCLNALAAVPVARAAGIPIVYEVRSSWEDAAVDSGACREGDLRYRVSRALETRACRQVDHVITICEGLRGELIGRGIDPARVTVVPNSVDLDRFTRHGGRDPDLATRYGLTAGRTLGFIGTFFPFEGLEVLVRAMPAILARDPAVRLVLVGDGPEETRVRALVAGLGIGHAVVLTGRVRHAEVERYYDLVDVLVYPRVSRRITELVTPLKPLEAMAQGKLVVASDVGGHREMVFPGRNGVLFAAGAPDSLAAACLDLLARPGDWERLREGGRRYVAEARSWSRTVSIYDGLYRGLLAGAGRARTA